VSVCSVGQGLVDFNLPNPLDSDHNNWLDTFLGDTVFQDSLISDDDPFQPQHVKSEHSYSMSNGTDNNPLDFPLDLSFEVKLETEKGRWGPLMELGRRVEGVSIIQF